MKQSNYNIFIPLADGNSLIFNTFTDSRVVVDKEAEEAVKACHLPDLLNKNQLEILNQLKDLGIIISDNVDESKELEYWFQKLKFDSSSIDVTILTTLACNMKCTYCFEQGAESSKSMTPDMVAKTTYWLTKKLDEVRPKDLNITFFGGEPLLNPEAVKQISRNLFYASKKRGTSLHIRIITNGLLLTPELVDFLTPYGLEWIKVTLDGDEKAHDRLRPRKNGSGTYQDIMNNLLKIKGKTNISIGGNYDDESKERIPHLLDDLKKTGFNGDLGEMAFKPILAFPGHEKSSSYLHEACTFSDTNTDDMFWLIKETEKRGFKTFKKIALGPCEAIREYSYTIDPHGDIYKCPALAGRKEYAIGHIDEGLNTTNVEFMTADVWRKCTDCRFVPLCNGGCRIGAILKDSKVDAIACEEQYFETVSKRLVALEAS